MKTSPTAKLLSTYVIFATIAVSVFVSPWNSIDPVSLPKLTVLGILSTIAFGLAMSNFSFIRSRSSRLILTLLGLFIAQMFLALIFSPYDFSIHFYGTSGRNTGFLAYFFLALLLFATASSASATLLRKFVLSLIVLGSILGLYGLCQSQGIDFFDY